MDFFISDVSEQQVRQEKEKARAEIEASKADINFGSQIRSYVFQPYTLVKDHRTGHETGDIIRVMDGALDPFMQAYLQWKASPDNGRGGKNGK